MSHGGTHFRIAERLRWWQGRFQDSKSRAYGPALWVLALNCQTLRRTAPVKARPAPLRGGPVHFSLDGGRAAEYTLAGQTPYRVGYLRLERVGRSGTFGFCLAGSWERSCSFTLGMSASIRAHVLNSFRLLRID